MADTVHLTNGSVVELDRHHWSGLASQESHSLTEGGRYITPRLVAMKHTDGRVLVYAMVKDGNKISGAGGELLPSQDSRPLAAALKRLASQFSRGPFLLAACLEQIKSHPAQ